MKKSQRTLPLENWVRDLFSRPITRLFRVFNYIKAFCFILISLSITLQDNTCSRKLSWSKYFLETPAPPFGVDLSIAVALRIIVYLDFSACTFQAYLLQLWKMLRPCRNAHGNACYTGKDCISNMVCDIRYGMRSWPRSSSSSSSLLLLLLLLLFFLSSSRSPLDKKLTQPKWKQWWHSESS